MNAPNKNQARKKVRRTLSMLGKPLDNVSSRGDADPATQSSRVSGPYFDANTQTYRVILFDGGKRKSVGSLKSMEEALSIKAEFERSLQAESSILMDTAIEEFLTDKLKQGLKPRSIVTLGYKLRYFLPLDQPVSSFTADQAQQLYEAETTKISRFGRVMRAQTHRKSLGMAKMFFSWAVGRKYARANPFAAAKPVGKPRAGKDQLRIDEARRLTQVFSDLAVAASQEVLPARWFAACMPALPAGSALEPGHCGRVHLERGSVRAGTRKLCHNRPALRRSRHAAKHHLAPRGASAGQRTDASRAAIAPAAAARARPPRTR